MQPVTNMFSLVGSVRGICSVDSAFIEVYACRLGTTGCSKIREATVGKLAWPEVTSIKIPGYNDSQRNI